MEEVPPVGLPCFGALLRGSLNAALFAWSDEWLSRYAALV